MKIEASSFSEMSMIATKLHSTITQKSAIQMVNNTLVLRKDSVH
jgi:hypothetical protein